MKREDPDDLNQPIRSLVIGQSSLVIGVECPWPAWRHDRATNDY
jgi:hypothetical protein